MGQLARSQQLLVGTPHILLLSKQLLVGAPHTNSGGMKQSREGWYPPSERTNGRLTDYRPIAKCMPKRVFPPLDSIQLSWVASFHFQAIIEQKYVKDDSKNDGKGPNLAKWRGKNGVCLHS